MRIALRIGVAIVEKIITTRRAMTDINTTSEPRLKKQHEKRRESWRARAERLGVSTRTLDRWVAAKIIDPPEYINGRKYGDADAVPRRDSEAA
jgi:hypothetical protein